MREREGGSVCVQFEVCVNVCVCGCMRVFVKVKSAKGVQNTYRRRILMRVYSRVSVALRIPRERLSHPKGETLCDPQGGLWPDDFFLPCDYYLF